MTRTRTWLALAALAVTVLAGCSRDDSKPALDTAAIEARKSYERSIMDWRAERVARLMKPDGWLSLVGMHWIEEGSTQIGTNPKFTARLAVGPDRLGIVTVKGDTITFRAEPGNDVTIDGQPAPDVATLVPDTAGEPTVVGFNKGDASFIVIQRGGKYALRVRDALAPTRTGFTGIDYFDIDPAFRFQAKFTPHPPGHKIGIVNILGMEEPMDNPGTLTIDVTGQRHDPATGKLVDAHETYTLEAIDEGDHRLFIVYADGTSGHESYAASRFVYADFPKGPDNVTELDFNKGYNPPCAFTAFSTCPLPPPSNRMAMRITAGEKKARKPDVPKT
jgi:uncharacterized protein (DUF1684 family)